MASPKKRAPAPVLFDTALLGTGPGFASENARGNEKMSEELFHAALEAGNPKQQFDLLEKALRLDPGNVDALLVMSGIFEGDELIRQLRRVVAIAAKWLGETAFKELVPHFWGFVETRPYMRARQALAEALRMAGRLDEAAKEYREMLVLNANDNQGVRSPLAATLLALNRPDQAQTLMAQYKNDLDCDAAFCWCHVLERLLSADEPGAVKALAAARKQNPHVEAYLLGRRNIPKTLPEYYGIGSKEEAICYADVLIMAWKPHPQAHAWLLAHPAKRAGKP